jgi:hypothetical protein
VTTRSSGASTFACDLDAVLAQYRAFRGQVELRVVPAVVADRVLATGPFPLAAALVDLLESPDAREKYAAEQLLAAAGDRLVGRSSRAL